MYSHRVLLSDDFPVLDKDHRTAAPTPRQGCKECGDHRRMARDAAALRDPERHIDRGVSPRRRFLLRLGAAASCA
eukprot:4580843-Alexandrium_andersonii.AAC.1